jgi:hypothetical protein
MRRSRSCCGISGTHTLARREAPIAAIDGSNRAHRDRRPRRRGTAHHGGPSPRHRQTSDGTGRTPATLRGIFRHSATAVRSAENRKVGGSIPPLATLSEQRRRRSGPGSGAFLLSGPLTAVDRLDPLIAAPCRTRVARHAAHSSTRTTILPWPRQSVCMTMTARTY